MGSQSGTSLMELMLAVVLIVSVVVTLSVSFSTASKHLLLNRQRWVATSLANTQTQLLKSQPYAYLDTTDHLYPAFFAALPNCDCNQVDFSQLPSTTTIVAGTAMNVASCVNYVQQGSLTPQCEASGDSGSKQILVRTWWSMGISTASVSQEALSIRS